MLIGAVAHPVSDDLAKIIIGKCLVFTNTVTVGRVIFPRDPIIRVTSVIGSVTVFVRSAREIVGIGRGGVGLVDMRSVGVRDLFRSAQNRFICVLGNVIAPVSELVEVIVGVVVEVFEPSGKIAFAGEEMIAVDLLNVKGAHGTVS